MALQRMSDAENAAVLALAPKLQKLLMPLGPPHIVLAACEVIAAQHAHAFGISIDDYGARVAKLEARIATLEAQHGDLAVSMCRVFDALLRAGWTLEKVSGDGRLAGESDGGEPAGESKQVIEGSEEIARCACGAAWTRADIDAGNSPDHHEHDDGSAAVPHWRDPMFGPFPQEEESDE